MRHCLLNSSFLSPFMYCIIVTLVFPRANQEACNSYSDCFNCSISSSSLCTWNNHTCSTNQQITSSSEPTSSSTYSHTFNSCQDYFALTSMTTLCGKSDIRLPRDTSFQLSLPDNNGYYGTTNTFCKYSISFTNIQITDKVDFTLHVNEIDNKPSILYLKTEVKYVNKNAVHIKEFKDNTSYKTQYEQIDTMVIYFYSPITLKEKPFTISFEVNKNDPKKVIYIIVGIVTAVCLICVISIYCFTKKLLKKKIEGENGENAQDDISDVPGAIPDRHSHNNNNHSSSEHHLHHHHHHHHHHKSTEKQIDTLFATSLTEIQYSNKVSSYGTNCTICLDNFTIGKSNVILTPCKHVFHKKCLSDWLHKNKSNPICPNCNLNFIDYEKQISKDSHQNNPNSNANTIIVHKKEDNKETTHQQGLIINDSRSIQSRNYSSNANTRQMLYLRGENNSERLNLHHERSSMSDFENVMS